MMFSCSVVFGTLVGVFVFMLCGLVAAGYWVSSVVISVRGPESGVCVHISGEDLVWYVCDVLYAVLYVRTSCYVEHGCAVSRRYIQICNCDMFSVVNVYLDHLKFRVVSINGRRYFCCRECTVVSNECNDHTPAVCNLSVHTVVNVCTLGVFGLGVSLVS